MSLGFKIAKSGVGVGTASDKDLILSSELNLFKIENEGSGSITVASSGQGTVEIDMSRSYPAFNAFYKDNNGKWRMSEANGNDPVDNVWSDSYVDGTVLKIEINNNTASEQTTK